MVVIYLTFNHLFYYYSKINRAILLSTFLSFLVAGEYTFAT